MRADVYAKAIFDLIKSGKDADSIKDGLLKSLKSRGALSLLPKVLNAYTKLQYKASAQGATLYVARDADVDSAIKELGLQERPNIKVDDRLIGGYRLESNGKLLDNSFKAKLLQAYRNATMA
jgi:F0F1-type ATP synthase delta subunit